MILSRRLAAIAQLVPDGARICDIGTDHAHLPIELIRSGKVKSAIAADINDGPLKNAEINILKSGINGIELKKSDGLKCIDPKRVDTVIIAGMGGEVISKILSDGNKNGEFSCSFILQPTTSPEILREHLYSNGYEIKKDIPLEDNGKIYSVMFCVFSGESRIMPEYKYYCGEVDPKLDEGRLYINKQYVRLKKCADALENNSAMREDYLRYLTISNQLEKLLRTAVNGT